MQPKSVKRYSRHDPGRLRGTGNGAGGEVGDKYYIHGTAPELPKVIAI
jgi:hypothetical protein